MFSSSSNDVDKVPAIIDDESESKSEDIEMEEEQTEEEKTGRF